MVFSPRARFVPIAVCLFATMLGGVPSRATASDDLNPFGVGSSAQTMGLYSSWLPKMATAGVKWVRLFPDWGTIEPTAGTWSPSSTLARVIMST